MAGADCGGLVLAQIRRRLAWFQMRARPRSSRRHPPIQRSVIAFMRGAQFRFGRRGCAVAVRRAGGAGSRSPRSSMPPHAGTVAAIGSHVCGHEENEPQAHGPITQAERRGEQLSWSGPWMRFSARTTRPSVITDFPEGGMETTSRDDCDGARPCPGGRRCWKGGRRAAGAPGSGGAREGPSADVHRSTSWKWWPSDGGGFAPGPPRRCAPCQG